MNKFKVGDRVVCSNPEVDCSHKTLDQMKNLVGRVYKTIDGFEVILTLDDDECRKCNSPSPYQDGCSWMERELSLLKEMNRNGANE